MGHSHSGKVGTMRHSVHTLLIIIVCLATQTSTSEVVEGSGEEEFDQDAAINEAVNKVTELVTSWADNLEDLDLDLEINQEENEITDEKAAKRKRKCAKCERKNFRGRNTEFCDGCQEEQEQEQELTTALTTPKSSNDNLKFNHNHNHRLINRRRKLEERCQKCTKNSFRARNDNFCSTKCAQGEADMEEVKTTTSTSTTTTSTTSTTTEMMTTTTEMNKKVARCLSRCSRRPSNTKWTEKCNTRCEKIAAEEMEEENENNNGKRKRNKKTKKQRKEKNHQDKEEDVVKKVGPLETFIKFLFKRS